MSMAVPSLPWNSRLLGSPTATPGDVQINSIASNPRDKAFSDADKWQNALHLYELFRSCGRCQDLIDYISTTIHTGHYEPSKAFFPRGDTYARSRLRQDLIDYLPETIGTGYYEPSRAFFPRGDTYARCRLCQFLKMVGVTDQNGIIPINMSSIRSSAIGPHDKDIIKRSNAPIFVIPAAAHHGRRAFAAVDKGLHIPSTSPRQVYAFSINYELIKGWIKECHYHIQKCGLPHAMVMRGFKVIDCQTRSIVRPGQRCPYVALSYVWGPQVSRTSVETLFPRTIADSIEVTLQLGYRYLWVDRYCIDQTNEWEKHIQIQNMDLIYNNADLTIIAAAGEDPHYGLPGVGSRSRRQQQCFKLHNIEFTEIFLFERLVQNSAWASRAWTLQESVLSRRKLIFTDCEVIFICNTMHQRESIQVEYLVDEIGHSLGLSRADLNEELVPAQLHHGDPYTNANRLMQECSSRRLSYSSDALNVCLGFLKHFRIHHWWGVLVQPLTGKRKSHSIYLDWSKYVPGRRRNDFPTWSWTSVSGRTRIGYISSSKDHCHECDIEVPLSNGTWQDIEKWSLNGASVELLDPKNCLRITGSLVPLRMISGRDIYEMRPIFIGTPLLSAAESGVLYALFDFQKGDIQGSSIARVYLDDAKDNIGSLSDVVSLVWYRGSRLPRSTPFMILLKSWSSGYRRVGIVTWVGPWNIFSLKLPGKAKSPTDAYDVLLPIPAPPPTTFELY